MQIRRPIRNLAKRYLPSAVATSRALRYVAGVQRAIDGGVGAEVGRRCGWKVSSGPFAGMKYPWWISGNVLVGPKLIGCFETELQPVIERLIARRYSTIINIGCAEGYYAVGLAARMPGTRVLAYEQDPVLALLCRKLARANDVANQLQMKGTCSPSELQRDLCDGAYLICDVEGYEHTLLDPVTVPGLLQCDLLIERHDGVNPEITPTLLSRFSASHHAQLIDLDPDLDRTQNLAPGPALSPAHRALAIAEFREHSRGWLELLRK